MADSGSSQVTAALSVFLISLLGFPATFFVNTAQTLTGERGLLVAGVVSLSAICVLTYFVLHNFKQKKDWLFYGMCFYYFSAEKVKHGGLFDILLNRRSAFVIAWSTVFCYYGGVIQTLGSYISDRYVM